MTTIDMAISFPQCGPTWMVCAV